MTTNYIDLYDNYYCVGDKFRGKLVIINNDKFKDPEVPRRIGTEKDVNRLKTTFSRLGFEPEIHVDQTTSDMLQTILKVRSSGLAGYDCLAVAILTHGELNGMLRGTGAAEKPGQGDLISLDSLFAPLKGIGDGKPKLVFIQACRGYSRDIGQWTQCDGNDDPDEKKFIKVPMETDFLYHFSSSPGYFSFRNEQGSIFIQALCDVADQYIEQDVDIDLLKFLTRVNRKVAEDYASKARDRELRGLKQMPSIVSMLRKDVMLKKKL